MDGETKERLERGERMVGLREREGWVGTEKGLKLQMRE